MRKRLFTLLFLLICSVIPGPFHLFAAAAHADQPRTVRVGLHALAQFTRIVNGNVSGYIPDQLTQISRYTGWNVEYVIMNSFAEELRALDAGRIDLAVPALHSAQRAQRYLYCAYAAGTSYTAIIAPGHSPVVYDDLDSIAKLRVGVLPNPIWRDDFLAFLRQRNAATPTLKAYPDRETARAALNKGEVDAVLDTVLSLHENEKILTKCRFSPFYYITRPDNVSLMRELERAIVQLKMEQPDLEYRLGRTYIPRMFQTPLSLAELRYISQTPPLRLGYAPNNKPYSWQDPATGAAKGILPDIARDAAARSGLRFTFIPFTEAARDATEDVSRQKIDLAFGFFTPDVLHASRRFRLTAPLTRSNLYLYAKPDNRLAENEKFTLAVPATLHEGQQYAAKMFPKAKLLPCPNEEACMKAAASGKAKAVLGDAMVANSLTNAPRFSEFNPVTGFSGIEEARIALGTDLPDMLLAILNNVLLTIDEKARSQIISSNISSSVTPYTLDDVLYEYRSLLLFAIALGGFILYMRRKVLLRQMDTDQRLARIADNINGGVISLSPRPPLQILKANNGFWQLLGYSTEQPRTSIFTDLLHKDDAKNLNSIMTNYEKSVNINMELRLRHANGAWLPMLLRGAIAGGTEHLSLDCVAVDITEQKRMQEELEQEKERYRILLEQSQDIFFDVDMEKRQFQCSPNFKLKFGRDASPLFDAKGHPQNKHIVHPADVPALNEMRRTISRGNPTTHAVLRIPTSQGRYLWCRVQATRISKLNAPLRLVGKIVDIDEEVRRREELERRTRADSLTGLLNKAAFRDKIRASMPAKPTQDKTDALLFLDLDNFKLINDTFGHVTGDNALLEASETLKRIFRNADAVGRFGGDEFCVFVKGITLVALRERAEALVSGLRRRIEEGGQTVEITTSIGIYMFDGTESSYEVALQRADSAQYMAKQAGKNCFRFYDAEAESWDDMNMEPRILPD